MPLAGLHLALAGQHVPYPNLQMALAGLDMPHAGLHSSLLTGKQAFLLVSAVAAQERQQDGKSCSVTQPPARCGNGAAM
jgi:hypothetical protein